MYQWKQNTKNFQPENKEVIRKFHVKNNYWHLERLKATDTTNFIVYIMTGSGQSEDSRDGDNTFKLPSQIDVTNFQWSTY